MNRQVDHSLKRLAAQKPSEDVPTRFPEIRPWEQPDMSGDGAEFESTPRTHVSRRKVLIAAGTTFAVGTGVVAVARQFATPSVVSPPLLTFQPAAAGSDAGALLRDLSARARQQPVPQGSGSFLYSQRREWSFATAVSTSGENLGTRMPTAELESWSAPDGTGRSRYRKQSQGEDARSATVENPLPPEKGRVPDPRSTSHDDLVAWFNREARDWETSRWFDAAKTWDSRLHDPAVCAAFLEALASRGGMKVEGNTTDRIGRRAIAVSTPQHEPGGWFPQKRLYLLCDPDTGELLARESLALTVDSAAVGVAVDVPATVYYLLWLDSAYVSDTSTEP